MSTSGTNHPEDGGLAPDPAVAGASGVEAQVPGTGTAVASQPQVEVADEPGSAPSTSHRRGKRRPCFQCGTMTPVPVLEKTGELCWRCYRPVGYLFLKNLLIVLLILGVVIGGLVAWRRYTNPVEATPQVEAARPDGETPVERQFTTEEKLSLLRRHFMDHESMSDLCTEYKVPPSEFRHWREEFFEAGEVGFQRDSDRELNAVERRIGVIDQKLQMATKVLSELRDNLVQLKKESGQYEISPTQRFILESGPPPK